MINLQLHINDDSAEYRSLVAFLHSQKVVFERQPVLPQADVSRSASSEDDDLKYAKECWKSGQKLSAISTVRSVYPILDLFSARNYCQKHFD